MENRFSNFVNKLLKREKKGLTIRIDTSEPAVPLSETDFSKFGGVPKNVPQDFTKGRNANLDPQNLATLNQRRFNIEKVGGGETEEAKSRKEFENKIFTREADKERATQERKVKEIEGQIKPNTEGKQIIQEPQQKNFISNLARFRDELKLTTSDIINNPKDAMARFILAGAVVAGGLAASPYAIGTAVLGGLYAINEVILSPAELATWAAVDNVAGQAAFLTRDLPFAVRSGEVSQAEADSLIKESKRVVREANTFVVETTAKDPKLWANSKILRSAIDESLRRIELSEAQLTQL